MPIPRIRLSRLLAVALLALLAATGCASPTQRLEARAADAGLERSLIQAEGFELVVFHAAAGETTRHLHVYLDGDGKPWQRGVWPERDPTPRHSLVLELMKTDPAPRAYLSRPCYSRGGAGPPCEPALWTDGRYSPTVVDALDTALDHMTRRFGARAIVLIGHSGGGQLAMLLAARRSDVAGVITIGANLDHGLWTRTKGYAPLAGSLNAAELPPLAKSTPRWHLVGGQDQTVPWTITARAARADPYARLIRFPAFDHHCCWAGAWPAILRDFRQAAGTGDPPRQSPEP